MYCTRISRLLSIGVHYAFRIVYVVAYEVASDTLNIETILCSIDESDFLFWSFN